MIEKYSIKKLNSLYIMRTIINLFIFIILFTVNLKADIILVNNTSSNTSAIRQSNILVSDWTNVAVNDLQTAIIAAQAGDEIWVKTGTYYPNAYPLSENGLPQGSTTRDYAFYNDKNNLEIYGGFSGIETIRNQRDFINNPTILSGDLGILATATDNSYHVFLIAHVNSTFILDGLTISDGYAAGNGSQSQNFNYSRNQGGGIFNFGIGSSVNSKSNSHPTLQNITLKNNHAEEGGGFYNFSGFGGVGSPSFTSCVIEQNTVSNVGAGIYVSGGSPSFTSCTFDGNSGGTGMGVFVTAYGASSYTTYEECLFKNHNGSSIIEFSTFAGSGVNNLINNCTFLQNTCTQGLINNNTSYNNSASTISNCVFTGNVGYSIHNQASQATFTGFITNCLFYDNNNFNQQAIRVTASNNSGVNNTTITNCTISGNSGGLTAWSSAGGTATADINNCIIWDNNSNDLYNYYSTINIKNSMTTTTLPTNVTNLGSNLATIDPLFQDATNDDYHLQPCSPALEAGDNPSNALNNDLDGQTRILNSNIDIGAYEGSLFSNLGTTSNATFTADYEITTNNGWTYYYDDFNTPANRADDIVILGIKKSGNNIGTVGDGTFNVETFTTANYNSGIATGITNPPALYVTSSVWHVMNRYWNVIPTSQPLSDLEVRTFFDNNDVTDINGSLAPIVISASDLFFYKINGSSYDLNPDNGHTGVPFASAYNMNGYWQYSHGTTASQNTWALGDFCGKYYAQYVIAEFSGGGGGAGDPSKGALPVEWISFEANIVEKNEVLLKWETASEINNRGFEIERSFDGQEWEYIGFIEGNGNNADAFYFDFLDNKPFNGRNYYRLKQMDFDETYEYSDIREINIENQIELNVFPNPVTDIVSINWNDAKTSTLLINIIDISGKNISSKLMNRNEKINLGKLPCGIYYLQLLDENNNIKGIEKIIKN
ncbi:MAG: hypothetical protein ACI94Y_001391 [Maribacter sp.]|jgi:hypothetical protein